MTAPPLPMQPMQPSVAPQQPSTSSFAPRQFAGRRVSGGGVGGGFGGQSNPMAPQGEHANGTLQQPQRPQFQTNRPPAAQGMGSAPTFAQMQAAGQARPAPPQQMQSMQSSMQPMQSMQGGGVQGALQSQLQQTLQNPSRYDLPQVQQVRDAFTGQLNQQFGAQQKQLDEEMARRGVGASSIASGYQGDLAGQQATAMANMNAQLIQNQAQTNAQDMSAALGAGQNYVTQQQANQLGQGNLGVAQQNATTGAQSVANQYALGQGNLGLGQQQLAQQGSQFGQTLGENARQFNSQQQLAQQLGLGNLGVAQENANTQQAGTMGNLALGQQQLGQQGSQFNQSLQQALGLAQMGDRTANRGIDVQGQQANNALMMQLAMLGIGNGISTGLTNLESNYTGSGGAGGTGGTGSGGGGGNGGNGGTPTSYNLLDTYSRYLAGQPVDPKQLAAAQQAMMSNPGAFAQAQMQMGNRDQWYNLGAPSINFGGQQYDQTQFYQLMQQHPELFGVQTQSGQNAAYNQNFFNNSTMTSSTPLVTDKNTFTPPPGASGFSPAATNPNPSGQPTDPSTLYQQKPLSPLQQQIQQAIGSQVYYQNNGPGYMVDPTWATQNLQQQDTGAGYTIPYNEQDRASGQGHFHSVFDRTSGQVWNPKTGGWTTPPSDGSDLGAWLTSMGYNGAGVTTPTGDPTALGGASAQEQAPSAPSALQQQWAKAGKLPALSGQAFFAKYPTATDDDWMHYANSFGSLSN